MPPAVDRALLLKRYPFGESSLVVHACTRAHGRVHLLAKGAYRITSRYYAVLDLFDTLELEWSHDPRRELCNLRAGSLLERRRSIPVRPRDYLAASTMLELADLASRPAHPDPALFDLLSDSFDALDEGRIASEGCLAAFELRYLRGLGLEPSLQRCATCGGPADPLPGGLRAAFSAGSGGRLCRPCAEQVRASGRRVGTLPVAVLDDASGLLHHGAGRAADMDPARIELVRDFAGRFLDYHLEARPRTHRAFLAVPNRNAPAITIRTP